MGALFREEIWVDQIRVLFDFDDSVRESGFDPLHGKLVAIDDPDFARKNIGQQFWLVIGEAGNSPIKSRLVIQNEMGEFTAHGLAPVA
jgi:hypothetical protein